MAERAAAVESNKRIPPLVCEGCGTRVFATLADHCYVCVGEDQAIEGARRTLRWIEDEVAEKRSRRLREAQRA